MASNGSDVVNTALNGEGSDVTGELEKLRNGGKFHAFESPC